MKILLKHESLPLTQAISYNVCSQPSKKRCEATYKVAKYVQTVCKNIPIFADATITIDEKNLFLSVPEKISFSFQIHETHAVLVSIMQNMHPMKIMEYGQEKSLEKILLDVALLNKQLPMF